MADPSFWFKVFALRSLGYILYPHYLDNFFTNAEPPFVITLLA